LDFTTTGVGPEISPQDLVFFVTLPSIASLEELEHLTSSVHGVERVESFVMIRIHDFPDWFDSHLESLGAGSASSPKPVRPRSSAARTRDPAGPDRAASLSTK